MNNVFIFTEMRFFVRNGIDYAMAVSPYDVKVFKSYEGATKERRRATSFYKRVRDIVREEKIGVDTDVLHCSNGNKIVLQGTPRPMDD